MLLSRRIVVVTFVSCPLRPARMSVTNFCNMKNVFEKEKRNRRMWLCCCARCALRAFWSSSSVPLQSVVPSPHHTDQMSCGSSLDSVSALSNQMAAKRAAERAANLQVQLEQLSLQGNVEAHSDAFVDLLSMMHAQFMPEREAAVEVLSEVVTTAFGDDGAQVPERTHHVLDQRARRLW